MKHNIVRTIFFFATLLLSLAAVATAQDGFCSSGATAGTWGYTEIGTLILPTGAVPFAAVGRGAIDADGNFSGTQNSGAGASASPNVVKATVTVNSDCTGTLKAGIYDPSGTILVRTAIFAVVFADQATEMQGIVTSLVAQPSGTSVPAVLTMNAKKLFPGRR